MSQTADIDGSFNNTVQIVGDGNQVTLTRARPLALSKYGEGHYRAKVRREFDLLKPYARALDIVGRDDERAALRDWVSKGEKLSVRVLTGQGGSGKTRLALDLCDSLPGEEWQAGFIDGDDLKTVCDDASMVAWAWRMPTLVVVDYAATYGEVLHRWLGRLVDHAKSDAPALRILLLERQADPQAGWWRTVFGGGRARDEAVRYLLDPEQPIAIEPLSAAKLRREIFLAALSRSAEELGKEPPAVEDSEDFDNRLANLTWGGRPLFLMMAAMLAARDGVGSVLALGRTDLAMDLARRELTRIGDAAEARRLDRAILETLAGYVTLCQGLEHDALIEAVGTVQQKLHRSGDAGPIADLLHDQLPAPNGAAAILPDIIGEAAMLLALDRGGIGPDLAFEGFQQTGAQAVASIIRTVQDFAGQSIADETITAPLEWLDAMIECEEVDLDLLLAVSGELTEIFIAYGTSLSMIDHARRVTEAIIARLELHAENNEILQSELARNKNNLSPLLSYVGRHDEALEAVMEAVAIRRDLATNDPDEFSSVLAGSLNNLSRVLSILGRQDEALETAKESVAIYRHRAVDGQNGALSEFATALNNLGRVFDEVGRQDEALEVTEEAIMITRDLVANDPNAYLPDFASSLHHLGLRLRDANRPDEALEVQHEAVAIYRELAAAKRDAFLPDLAHSLAQLGHTLSNVDLRDGALKATKEAFEIRCELASMIPDAFLPQLVNSGVVIVCLLEEEVEAILHLSPAFAKHPAALASLMMTVCERYIERCEALGKEPDKTLITPITEQLQLLEEI